jgi:hypothetical protein
MNDFIRETLKSARKTAEEVFDKLEKAVENGLKDVQDTFTEPVKEDNTVRDADYYKGLYSAALGAASILEIEVQSLSEELAEAHEALKLFLDGETSRTFHVSMTRSDSLADYIIETYWQGDAQTGNQLVVRQRRI